MPKRDRRKLTGPKRANLRPQGYCIFCGGPGLTDEHLLPDSWMRRIFPRTSTATQESTTETAVGKVGMLPPPDKTSEIIQGSIFSITLHVVCKRCNGGWMHRLEDKNGPLLLRLISATGGSLTVDGQRLLATWLAKTTMVAEFIKPESVTISVADRLNMKDRLTIPNGWKMWIANTTGSKWKGNLQHVSSHGLALLDPIDPNAPPMRLGNAQVTFFGLNTFLAVVFSSSAAIADPEFKSEWATGLHQIWPIVSPRIMWPSFPLRDEEIDAIFDGFTKYIQPIIKSGSA